MANRSSPKARLQVLKRLLEEGDASTQEELCEQLVSMGYEVTQSTISRSLRRLGAVKTIDENGQTVYRLIQSSGLPLAVETSLSDLVLGITHNGSTIVVKTTPGSASLVARHLDTYRPGDLLGTIAGDDTIFVAPKSLAKVGDTVSKMRASLNI